MTPTLIRAWFTANHSPDDGPTLGKGGIDTTPSEERAAPVAPPQFQFRPEDNPESLSKSKHAFSGAQDTRDADVESGEQKLLPRETGHDIGMGSPVPLSSEAVDVITKLRTMKDEDEDWSRWRDVVFRAKGALHPNHIVICPPPPQNERRRGGARDFTEECAGGRGDSAS
ncbi:hypothetical protein EW026_g6756 [Hermanssonia centrifuga]|uniref:Uncharacterized protein n=1 Tax=Hermanssonia centrifuga TaxID=98765 RepID=A0A4S4KAY9_9APHY|nr:hypothetical protein EW026_g6756 [Hermanssonia centrifuga]